LAVDGRASEGPVTPASEWHGYAARMEEAGFLSMFRGLALIGVSALIGDANDPLGIAGSIVAIVGLALVFLGAIIQTAETPDPTSGAARGFRGFKDETWPPGEWLVGNTASTGRALTKRQVACRLPAQQGFRGRSALPARARFRDITLESLRAHP